MLMTDRIRTPAVSGMFYPSNPSKLLSQIENMLSRISVKPIAGKLCSLVVPHAGYVYSGFTAANAFSILRENKFSSVIIISPSHREWFSGISLYNGRAYSTPLGSVEVNNEIRTELLKYSDIIIASETGHREEHAIEVQLPFLQCIVKDFTFVPLVIGDQNRHDCMRLGEVLCEVLKNREAVVIASSDLSHYYPESKALKLDRIAAQDIRELDTQKFLDDIDTHRTEACGAGPIAATMKYAQLSDADCSEILYQCTSAEFSGDTTQVVGYLSAAMWKHIPSIQSN